MGSLLSGWDSPVLDPKKEKYKRNWSLTKGEVEAYWRSKKKTEEEHLKALSGLSESHSSEEITPEKNNRRSSSLPMVNTKESFMEEENENSLEKLIKTHGWWTKSSWAFLNEPPVLAEGGSNTYGTQFHVANRKFESNSDGSQCVVDATVLH